MSSSDLNLPDLAQSGGVAQARSNAPTDTQEDMRERSAAELRPVFDVPVSVQAVIGRTTIEVAKLLELSPGTVLELDRRVGKPSISTSTRVWLRVARSSSSTIASA